MEQEVFLKRLDKIITSNRESMMTLKDSLKKETPAVTSVTSTTEAGSRVTKLTKLIKVPTWSRNMSLETFMKQLQTYTEINKEIPEFMNDLMES